MGSLSSKIANANTTHSKNGGSSAANSKQIDSKTADSKITDSSIASMSLEPKTDPPQSAGPYLISQLEGEKITIPGSKGVFRILASEKQTRNKIAVFTSGAVLSDAPGFHYHNEAHDVFLVTKGYMKLWNGDKCRLMGPGDFAYVPPKVIHNPEMIGPHTELIGLIAPGDWVDFFRYVAEPVPDSLIVPEFDDRDLKGHIIPKIMAAKDRFDVQFVREYDAPTLSDWDEGENVLPEGQQAYFLRSMSGPRWMAGGVMSRPFVTTMQCGGRFAISSIESSSYYTSSSGIFSRALVFDDVDHCLCVQEGRLAVSLQGVETTVHEGETVVIPAGHAFKLAFKSKYVRIFSFSSGDGLEALIQDVGESQMVVVLPDKAPEFEGSRLEETMKKLNVRFG